MSRQNDRISRLFFFEGVSFGLFLASIGISLIELARFLQGEFKFAESPWVFILPIFISTYVSIRSVAEQSRLQIKFESERYDRDKLLAQAELPLALSLIGEKCSFMMRYHFTQGLGQVDWDEFDRHFDGLKPAIRSSGQQTANRLLKAIRTYQVLRARMQRFDPIERDQALNDPTSPHVYTVYASAINWATLHSIIGQAFAYARGIDEEIPSEEVGQSVYSAFFLNGIMIENYPTLKEILSSRAKRGFEMEFSSD